MEREGELGFSMKLIPRRVGSLIRGEFEERSCAWQAKRVQWMLRLSMKLIPRYVSSQGPESSMFFTSNVRFIRRCRIQPTYMPVHLPSHSRRPQSRSQSLLQLIDCRNHTYESLMCSQQYEMPSALQDITHWLPLPFKSKSCADGHKRVPNFFSN